jgi:hypothetical protein
MGLFDKNPFDGLADIIAGGISDFFSLGDRGPSVSIGDFVNDLKFKNDRMKAGKAARAVWKKQSEDLSVSRSVGAARYLSELQEEENDYFGQAVQPSDGVEKYKYTKPNAVLSKDKNYVYGSYDGGTSKYTDYGRSRPTAKQKKVDLQTQTIGPATSPTNYRDSKGVSY